jgi:hypothetical protein
VVGITMGTAAAPLCFAGRPARDPQRRVTCCVHALPGAWEIDQAKIPHRAQQAHRLITQTQAS